MCGLLDRTADKLTIMMFHQMNPTYLKQAC